MKIRDKVIMHNNLANVGEITDITLEETGRFIYKVKGQGSFYLEDLKLASDIPDINKAIIVTGGAGYIGSVLVGELLRNGYKVICIDNLSAPGSEASLLSVWDDPNFVFEKCDITNFSEVDRVIDSYPNCYGIVHLAAIVGDPACKLEPELAKKVNYDATRNLFNKAASAKIKRFVFASTCSVYGVMQDPNGYVDESSRLNPVSLYAELKAEIDEMIILSHISGFYPTSLRLATAYGISPRTRFDLTVNEFTKVLSLGQELIVYGEQLWRPYCHVQDIARAILTVLEAPEQKVRNNVFNVGGENYTKKMIVAELLKIIPEAKVKYVKKNKDLRSYKVEFDKIKAVGFEIAKTIREGIMEISKVVRSGILDNTERQCFYNILKEL